MTKKFSEARRAAFLKGVAETGNQTVAAARARVSRSWVTMTRAAEPGFDAAVRAAVDAARARLGSAETRRAPRGWGSLDGVELAARGTNGRRCQIARATLREWSPETEDRFLATLSATCNVKAACAEVGRTYGRPMGIGSAGPRSSGVGRPRSRKARLVGRPSASPPYRASRR